MIKLLVFDIDGILTNGSVSVDELEVSINRIILQELTL